MALTFTQSRDQLITDAFELIGVYGVGRTVSNEDMSFASNCLNKMVKAWEVRGLHLWTKGEAILIPIQYTAKYSLGTVYCADLSNITLMQTQNTYSAATTSITVNSTTGMNTNDYLGVQLANGAIYWTTVASITNSTTFVLAVGLPSAVNSLAMVYDITTLLPKPLRITNARLQRGFDKGVTSTLYDLPLTSLSYSEYFDLPIKTSNGIPNQFHYNPQNTAGYLYLWPRPTGQDQRIRFSYERSIADLDNSTDNFDFPVEWLECITWQLALRLCPAFGKDQKMVNSIQTVAQDMYQNLLFWDNEITSMQMSPDRPNG